MLLKKTFKIFSHQNRMKNDEKCDQSTVMLSLEIIKSWNAVIVSKWSPSPPMQCKLHYNISRRKHIIAFFSWNAAKIPSSRQLLSLHTHAYLHHPLAEMEPGLPLQQGSLPRVGYGCWNLGQDMAATCVKHAIRWTVKTLEECKPNPKPVHASCVIL